MAGDMVLQRFIYICAIMNHILWVICYFVHVGFQSGDGQDVV